MALYKRSTFIKPDLAFVQCGFNIETCEWNTQSDIEDHLSEKIYISDLSFADSTWSENKRKFKNVGVMLNSSHEKRRDSKPCIMTIKSIIGLSNDMSLIQHQSVT